MTGTTYWVKVAIRFTPPKNNKSKKHHDDTAHEKLDLADFPKRTLNQGATTDRQVNGVADSIGLHAG